MILTHNYYLLSLGLVLQRGKNLFYMVRHIKNAFTLKGHASDWIAFNKPFSSFHKVSGMILGNPYILPIRESPKKSRNTFSGYSLKRNPRGSSDNALGGYSAFHKTAYVVGFFKKVLVI